MHRVENSPRNLSLSGLNLRSNYTLSPFHNDPLILIQIIVNFSLQLRIYIDIKT